MRFIMILAFLVMADGAHAMTCADFRAGLDRAILAGGRRVASPHFKIIPGAAAQPDDGSIAGLDTLLTCADDGALQAVDITASIDNENDAENLRRHTRFDALVGATLCTIEPSSPKTCYARAQGAQVAAIDQFLAAKRRGDTQPSGFDILTFKKLDATPSVKAKSGTITFNLDLTN